MKSLTVKCKQCKKVAHFDWCFDYMITLLALKCNKYLEKYILELPKQKTENIITHTDFLTFEEIYPVFHLETGSNTFCLDDLHKKEIKLPILELERTISKELNGKMVTVIEDGLVQLEDVGTYINKKF